MTDRQNTQGDDNIGSPSDSRTDGMNRSGSDRSSSNIGSRPSKDSGYGASDIERGSRDSRPETPRKRRLDDEPDPSDNDSEDFDNKGLS
ncbi:MAG: hypothetical protein ABJF01_13615 [bacterium]